jgi:hypothetical protein
MYVRSTFRLLDRLKKRPLRPVLKKIMSPNLAYIHKLGCLVTEIFFAAYVNELA